MIQTPNVSAGTGLAVGWLLAGALLGACAAPDARLEAAGEAGESVAAGAAAYPEPPAVVADFGVEEAYAAIPHRRTVWDAGASPATAAERAYLEVAFTVAERATAVRVGGLRRYWNEDFAGVDVLGGYDGLIAYLASVEPPPRLAAYHGKLAIALADQRAFFAEWERAEAGFPHARDLATHPKVRSASAALKAAYRQLMSRYPGEGAHNRDAFFDVHCALDFL